VRLRSLLPRPMSPCPQATAAPTGPRAFQPARAGRSLLEREDAFSVVLPVERVEEGVDGPASTNLDCVVPELPLRRDAEALVDLPATRRELFAGAGRHLAGEPGRAIGGLEVVSLCHAADALRPRDVVHGGGEHHDDDAPPSARRPRTRTPPSASCAWNAGRQSRVLGMQWHGHDLSLTRDRNGWRATFLHRSPVLYPWGRQALHWWPPPWRSGQADAIRRVSGVRRPVLQADGASARSPRWLRDQN